MSPVHVSLVAALLRRVRQRLTPAGAWGQHEFARTIDGVGCASEAPESTCWCLEGALILEGNADAVAILGARQALTDTLGLGGAGLTLAGWNDAPGRTHDEVLGVLDFTTARLDRAHSGAAA